MKTEEGNIIFDPLASRNREDDLTLTLSYKEREKLNPPLQKNEIYTKEEQKK
jgi:hypothetical protein